MIFSGACERVLLQQGAIADLSSWWQRHAVVQWQAENPGRPGHPLSWHENP